MWVDTYPTLDEETTAEELDAFAEPFQRDFPGHTRQFVRGMFPPTADPALVERVAEDMASAPPDVALDAAVHAWGNDGPAIAALERLTVPVVQIRPDDGPTDVESLARHGVGTVIVHGVRPLPDARGPRPVRRGARRGDRRLRLASSPSTVDSLTISAVTVASIAFFDWPITIVLRTAARRPSAGTRPVRARS